MVYDRLLHMCAVVLTMTLLRALRVVESLESCSRHILQCNVMVYDRLLYMCAWF